jgi:glycosyltransferase involved in cell wall biosynthesis
MFGNPADIILNWVDEAVFSEIGPEEKARARKSLNIAQNIFAITSVGTCLDKKNHKDILHALRLSHLVEKGCYYIHVGTGPLLLKEQALAKTMGVDNHVMFVGQRPSNKVREVYAACDVVVMPSDYEGLPMVIMEAMKCGRPVIAYDAPGLRDYNHDQKGGMWIAPSTDALVEALQEFAGSPDLLRRKSAEALAIAEKYFSKNESLRALAQLYSSAK